MLATEYATYYNITLQQTDESDYNFRHRVAGALRDAGHIIEAHEAQQDARYEDSADVLTGILVRLQWRYKDTATALLARGWLVMRLQRERLLQRISRNCLLMNC